MNTGVKISAFAAALAVTFGAAYGVGSGVSPLSTEPADTAHDGDHGEGSGNGEKGEHGDDTDAHEDAPPGGLQISEQGYALDLQTPRIAAEKKSELRFQVRDEDGDPLTSYSVEHGKELHLILASRDLDTFRHLHPTRASDGTWSTDVTLPDAGDYRLFADFKPDEKGAKGLTLGTDLAVSGTYEPSALPKQSRTVKVDDGYEVTLDGELTPGKPADVTLRVTKDGKPVTDLQPYLGAYGHLVALRAGDLAYLHVHPGGEPDDGSTKPGPAISFTATAPTAGTYRLFLDFQHEGTVRTAEFTVSAGDSGAAGGEPSKPAKPSKPAEDHDH